MSINVIQNSLDVNDFCATIFVDMRYSMLTVLAVYCVIIPIYWQTASKNSATHQRQAKSAQTPQQPTPTPQTINVDTVNVNKFNVPQQTESAGKPDDNRKESPSYFYRLISPENLPNLILSAIGIAGIVVGIWTLKAIRKQADLMREAGVQAGKQLQHLVNSERAWLIVEIEMIGNQQKVKNSHYRSGFGID